MFAIENLHKRFAAPGGAVRAVDGVSLQAETGKLVTLLGPSGCGKTTTLRCLAGLEQPEAGRIVIDGTVVFDSERGICLPASERGIGMVFQSYAIWPHMTVFENVAFPLRVARGRKYRPAEIKERVHRVLGMVRLDGYDDRPATQLSGGQQQRLAFARGLVREPKLLLLDEPLSNLDAKLREQMRIELRRIQTTLAVTTVYVTHDQAEALALSDEVAVFNDGRIVQRGTPREIYHAPQNPFVADFIGSANFLAGTVADFSDAMVTVDTAQGLFRCAFAKPVRRGDAVLVAARPEDLTLHAAAPEHGANLLAGTVAQRIFLGEVVDYLVAFGGGEIRVRARSDAEFHIGQPVHVAMPPQKCIGLPR
jgi:iron(III) transport system ATP-binding protein